MGVLLLLLVVAFYAVTFWFVGLYTANMSFLALVMLSLGAWRHVVTGGTVFATLALAEYIMIRVLVSTIL